MDSDRYAGKPFLRVLECYVLWAVGELGVDQAETLERMTPKLRQTYHAGGSWQEIVAAQMEFSESMPDALRSMWDKNQAIARENGVVLEAEEFARMVVDSNYV